jgi:NAD(P)H-dependent flavin oxidoreductase YrpB (nitropropane dioxygenase family)
MTFTTPFTRLVGCDVPIQQAPIGFAAAVPELPVAVAAAGAHGMLAAAAMPPAVLAQRLDALNARTRAYGVNFIQPLATPEAIEVAAEKAPLIEFYFGEADPALVATARAQGALVCRQVTSAEEARAAQDAGCDLVVARGIEAGGRATGGIGLLPLLDGVLDAVQIPVLAAGGIATGRGVAAVLAAGAAGARVGTRFLVAEEAATHPVHVQAVLAAGYAETVLTDAFSADTFRVGHRVLRSSLDAAEAFDGDHVATMTVNGEQVLVPRFSPHNPAADARGAVEAMALYAGQGVGAVRRRQPAAEIVAELTADAAALLHPAPEMSRN